MRKYPAAVLLVVLALALYLPTLRTGFLADDFLDAETTFSSAPGAFSEMMSSGYRPLMSYSWALDNFLWGICREWGWHLTNLLILAAASVSLWFFIRLFVRDVNAVLAGLALFVFCCPVAVSVAKVDWRTSLLPVIPLLWSMYFLVRRSRGDSGFPALVLSSLFLLFSVFLKEIALAVPPAFAVLAWSQAGKGRGKRAAAEGFIAAVIPVTAYLLVRYFTVGFSLGYGDSSSFGPFMVKNLLLLMGMVLKPWLSAVPARILLPLFIVFMWLLPAEKRLKAFIGSYSFFILFTVSNLPIRFDYAVPVLPVFSLSTAILLRKCSGRKAWITVLLFLSGILLSSIDEVRMIGGASDTLREETETIASVADEIPGNGPLFIQGVREAFGSYATFWPGDFMMPLSCAGMEPSRCISGTERMWEHLLQCEETGHLVFLENGNGYSSFPVSKEMYEVLPDTTVFLEGAATLAGLQAYPSCVALNLDETLILVSGDSLVTVFPEEFDGGIYIDLASVPEWVIADSSTVIVYRGELVFTGRNVALEKALRVLEAKRNYM